VAPSASSGATGPNFMPLLQPSFRGARQREPGIQGNEAGFRVRPFGPSRNDRCVKN
jgi:hypothetical protein